MSTVITVHYGIDECPKNFDRDNVTVGEVIGNSTVKSALGYGDNVKAMVSGVEVPNSAVLSDGDHLYLEVKANSKAIDETPIVVDDMQEALSKVNTAIEAMQSISRKMAGTIKRSRGL